MTTEAGGLTAVTPRGDAFDCPRCRRPFEAELYGPCSSCVDELRARYAPTGREIEIPEYSPKVNVTPNAVAQRPDD